MDAVAFSRIAPALKNPLTLIGLCLFLIAVAFRVLIQSKILPGVDSATSASLLSRILNYGFVISLLIIVLGFSFAYQTAPNKPTQNEPIAPISIQTSGDKAPITQGKENNVSIR